VLRFQKFYLKKPDSEIDPNLRPRCLRVLALMDEHLEGRRYFVGESLSLADIALVAYTRFAHQAGLDLAQYPQVARWVRRIEHYLSIEHAS
jgi:glutathione S-transferase